jgi:hypothetical protein
MPPTFDIYDQATLTQLINEPVDTALESAPRLGDQIAPLQNTESRMARMDIGRQYSFGIGQFKAPNAMPALVEMPVTERREALIEMAQLEEMHRINSEQWMRLRSELLADGTQFVIHDAGWRPMASGADRSDAAHTRYLPVGKVLITTPYTIEGERIADTLNGQVDISVAYNEAEPTMGPANEVILNHLDKNRYLREAASRIVRLLHPECFLAATVR